MVATTTERLTEKRASQRDRHTHRHTDGEIVPPTGMENVLILRTATHIHPKRVLSGAKARRTTTLMMAGERDVHSVGIIRIV